MESDPREALQKSQIITIRAAVLSVPMMPLVEELILAEGLHRAMSIITRVGDIRHRPIPVLRVPIRTEVVTTGRRTAHITLVGAVTEATIIAAIPVEVVVIRVQADPRHLHHHPVAMADPGEADNPFSKSKLT